MSTKSKLLQILQENYGSFVSGQKIAKHLGISRAAVNKASKALKESGYKILSRPNQGYKLLQEADILSQETIEMYIPETCDLKLVDRPISEDDRIKKSENIDRPLAIVTTAGPVEETDDESKKRSDRNGLYLSILSKPDFSLEKANMLPLASALAVIHAIDEVCSLSARIQWVNDIFIAAEKVASIMTRVDANLESNIIHGLEITIDLNCFPDKSKDHASNSLNPISDSEDSFSRAELAGAIINNILHIETDLLNQHFLPEYKRKCFIIGKIVSIRPFAEKKPIKVRVLDISDTGGLVIEYMEGIRMREIETLTSGIISEVH